jgi:hypothetical protein
MKRDCPNPPKRNNNQDNNNNNRNPNANNGNRGNRKNFKPTKTHAQYVTDIDIGERTAGIIQKTQTIYLTHDLSIQ